MTKFRDVPDSDYHMETRQRKNGNTEWVYLSARANGSRWEIVSSNGTDTIQIEKRVGKNKYLLFMDPMDWELVKDMVETAENMIDRRNGDPDTPPSSVSLINQALEEVEAARDA